jgi:protein associated with RNAse G/E
MQIGDRIRITALHSDGLPYRWWMATVEEISPERLVTFAPAGEPVYQLNGPWPAPNHMRAYYWAGRPYNLLEFFTPQMEPVLLYVHIASPPRVTADGIEYVDLELDIVKRSGEPAFVDDEAEFAEAARRYGYSEALQAECRSAVAEALAIVESWEWAGNR